MKKEKVNKVARLGISDNIRLGKENASDEEVKEACRLANAIEFIQDLPEVSTRNH